MHLHFIWFKVPIWPVNIVTKTLSNIHTSLIAVYWLIVVVVALSIYISLIDPPMCLINWIIIIRWASERNTERIKKTQRKFEETWLKKKKIATDNWQKINKKLIERIYIKKGKGKQQLLKWIKNAPSNDKYQNNTSDSISNNQYHLVLLSHIFVFVFWFNFFSSICCCCVIIMNT